jgi:hypothetical protein
MRQPHVHRAATGCVTGTLCELRPDLLRHLRKIGRILWNIATGDEVIKRYPRRALEVVWNALGRPTQSWRPVRATAELMYRRACRTQDREGDSTYTRFFRNLPQLQVLRDVVLEMDCCASLKIASLGCSSGAELYSALWMIRTARSDLSITALGIDISGISIQKAVAGIYQLGTMEVEGITHNENDRLFARRGDVLSVQDWLREDTTWHVANACSATLLDEFGPQDVVLANNFLCHMSDDCAEACLRNIVKLVVPNGYLFLWGIDLDVKTRVARAIGLIPVTARIKEIYNADRAAREAWPLKYWGIEPMETGRSDWKTRYATVFRLPGHLSAVAVR